MLNKTAAPRPSPWRWPSSARGRGAPAPGRRAGADLGRGRCAPGPFGPNVLTSHRVTALGVLTRLLRNLAPWALPLGHRGGRPPERSYRQGAGYTSD